MLNYIPICMYFSIFLNNVCVSDNRKSRNRHKASFSKVCVAIYVINSFQLRKEVRNGELVQIEPVFVRFCVKLCVMSV